MQFAGIFLFSGNLANKNVRKTFGNFHDFIEERKPPSDGETVIDGVNLRDMKDRTILSR